MIVRFGRTGATNIIKHVLQLRNLKENGNKLIVAAWYSKLITSVTSLGNNAVHVVLLSVS